MCLWLPYSEYYLWHIEKLVQDTATYTYIASVWYYKGQVYSNAPTFLVEESLS